jgi:hypothetical protein
MSNNQLGPLSGIVVVPDEPPIHIAGWTIPRQRLKTIARYFSVVGLLGVAGWFIQNFLQVRGVVNLFASRLFLGAAVLFLALAVLALMALWGRPRIWIRILVVLMLIGVGVAVDYCTPKPSPKPLTVVELQVICDDGLLPIHIPNGSSINILEVNPFTFKSNAGLKLVLADQGR